MLQAEREAGRPSLSAAAQKRRPVLVIAPETAEAEATVEPNAVEFTAGALADVSSPQPKCAVPPGLQGVQGFADAGVDAVRLRRGPCHLFLQDVQVVGEDSVNGRGRGVEAQREKAAPDDGPVRHPVEAKPVARVSASMGPLEGELQGPPPDTTCGDEGPVDVEQPYGGWHESGRLIAPFDVACEQTGQAPPVG